MRYDISHTFHIYIMNVTYVTNVIDVTNVTNATSVTFLACVFGSFLPCCFLPQFATFLFVLLPVLLIEAFLPVSLSLVIHFSLS